MYLFRPDVYKWGMKIYRQKKNLKIKSPFPENFPFK